MSLTEVLAVTTGGLRSALSLLGVMVAIVTLSAPAEPDRARALVWRVATMFAASAILFSPVHAATLLGYNMPALVTRFADLFASMIGCVALLFMLKARAIQRGVPMVRVRRAMYVNASIVLSFILVAWSTR